MGLQGDGAQLAMCGAMLTFHEVIRGSCTRQVEGKKNYRCWKSVIPPLHNSVVGYFLRYVRPSWNVTSERAGIPSRGVRRKTRRYFPAAYRSFYAHASCHVRQCGERRHVVGMRGDYSGARGCEVDLFCRPCYSTHYQTSLRRLAIHAAFNRMTICCPLSLRTF